MSPAKFRTAAPNGCMGTLIFSGDRLNNISRYMFLLVFFTSFLGKSCDSFTFQLYPSIYIILLFLEICSRGKNNESMNESMNEKNDYNPC